MRAAITIVIAQRPRATAPDTKWVEAEMGSRTAPHFLPFCCVASEATPTCTRVFGRPARESGVLQLWFSSKPGGVMLPPEPDELTSLIYSCGGGSASE